MDTASNDNISNTLTAFESALEGLVLENFARGVPIEDTWTIITPLADSPNWAITIEKIASAEESPYEPHVLDEG